MAAPLGKSADPDHLSEAGLDYGLLESGIQFVATCHDKYTCLQSLDTADALWNARAFAIVRTNILRLSVIGYGQELWERRALDRNGRERLPFSVLLSLCSMRRRAKNSPCRSVQRFASFINRHY
jgi:hypothetical protein